MIKHLVHIVILASLMCGSQGHAQTKVYGVHYGMGKSMLSAADEEPYFVSPIDDGLEDHVQIGLDYMWAPRNTSIFFKSGLTYNARTTDETAIDYIRAPLGLDIGIGNAFQVIVGANVYTSFMLAHTGFENNDAFRENMRRLQFGWGGNLGFGIGLSPKVNVNVVYQRWFDLTEVYSLETRTQEGFVTEEFFGQDGLVRMGLQYRIIQP